MNPLALRHGLAFLMGFSVALLPAYGPFLGLLFFFGTRWRLARSDLLWLAAALLLALPLGLHEGLAGLLFGGLQVLAPWLVYKAFRQIRALGRAKVSSRHIGLGLFAGFFIVVVLGWLQIDALNFLYARTIAQAIVWQSHPSLYGHTILALGALIAILFADARLRMASLGIAAFGILITGSREAAIAWVLVAVSLMIIRYKRTERTHLLEITLVLAMLAVAAGLGPALGWGRVGFLVDLLPPAEPSRNLLQGTEVVAGDWWDAMGVEVEATPIFLQDRTLTRYTVTKTEAERWMRLQQVVPLRPALPYSLSVWLREPAGEARPGLESWGQALGEDLPFIVTGVLENGEWRATVSGPGRILDAGVLASEGDWKRVWISFQYEGGASTLYWWVGLAPDQRQGLGESAEFAGFQLEQGPVSDYRPGPASKGLGLSIARLPYWETALEGIRERFFAGWGQGSFASFFEARWPHRNLLHDAPAHAHNLFLDVLFERGLAGLIGLALLLAALAQAAWRKADWALLAVFTALLVANLFDSTLFYGGVIYPLAAVAGWRAATYRPERSERQDLSRQASAGLALSLTDYLMAALALALAYGTRELAAGLFGLPPLEENFGELWRTLAYALLLWPAMFWREGLYLGYGLSSVQELKKQVTAVAFAGLILAAATLLFSDLALPRNLLVLTAVYSMILCPLGRGLAKHLLHKAGLWGKPVFVLGAGRTGRRVAKALLDRPLEGLVPVALFDDDPRLHGCLVEGIRVEGPLDAAYELADHIGVRHAIVAIPRISPRVLTSLIGAKGRAFRQVQFVPELSGLPSSEVYASSLADRLALEVRNGLHSERNRLVKRSLDAVFGFLAALLALPLLVILYLWVRLDSPGPAFHASERLGQQGKPFRCLKFRTMYIDAEAQLEAILAKDEALRREYENYRKLDSDPRVTRAGRFLRRYSLDELPQLHNVLKGEMSLVGPRPYLVSEFKDMRGYEEAILEAKPGMTGYWQVSGRNELTFLERLKMEAHYVRNWSIWWDILILAQTLGVVASRKGAK
jgi:Undecaprenyl-phosphate galactose phosphotransferase WbaP